MSTLDEIIYYCNEKNPIGALVLTGEWGCGKTYLIEHDLTKALKDTHVIVRISLFGMDNTKSLHAAIRQKWFEDCMPVLGSLQKAREKGFFSAFSSVLKKFNPVAGGAADVMVSMNVMELVQIKPEVEDFITHKTKKVILVYDDLEKSKIDVADMMGVINNYCENHKFNSIVVVNEESLAAAFEKDRLTYHMLKEKTVAETIHHAPVYRDVIKAILGKAIWKTPEYAEYLNEHEDLIREVFISESERPERTYLTKQDRKYHNFRALTKGLQSFYRIYFHIQELGKDVPDSHLYSFLAYYLVAKSGICRGGSPCIEFGDDDVKEFYPEFSPENLTNVERYWITTGIWDIEVFEEELLQSLK
ncbi:MAG: hypothetical protein IKE85_08785 [Mogibacterium sp.]|nr:hypothetical protein [Mogibacterium sp.]